MIHVKTHKMGIKEGIYILIAVLVIFNQGELNLDFFLFSVDEMVSLEFQFLEIFRLNLINLF